MMCWTALSGMMSGLSSLQLVVVAVTSPSRCLLPRAVACRFTSCWSSCCCDAVPSDSLNAA